MVRFVMQIFSKDKSWLETEQGSSGQKITHLHIGRFRNFAVGSRAFLAHLQLVREAREISRGTFSKLATLLVTAQPVNQNQLSYQPTDQPMRLAFLCCWIAAAIALGVVAVGCGEKGTSPSPKNSVAGKDSQKVAADAGTTQQPMSNQYDVPGLERYRAEKDSGFRQRESSPLTERVRARFRGLLYYPAATQFWVAARLQQFPNPEPVNLMTTTGQPRPMLRYGQLHFTVDGKECALTAYQSADHPQHLFLPFKDATNGTETYGAGRYIDLTVQPGSSANYMIDFNLAYNPYCAYNPEYSCPVVPRENFLAVPIRAGERVSETDEH